MTAESRRSLDGGWGHRPLLEARRLTSPLELRGKSLTEATTRTRQSELSDVRTNLLLLLLVTAMLGSASSAFATTGQVTIPARFKGIILAAPEPDYQRWVGATFTVRAQGVYRLKINPTSGVVDEVGILTRCGEQRLDAAAVMAFMNWRFKPNCPIKELDVPIIYDRFVDVRLDRSGVHTK